MSFCLFILWLVFKTHKEVKICSLENEWQQKMMRKLGHFRLSGQFSPDFPAIDVHICSSILNSFFNFIFEVEHSTVCFSKTLPSLAQIELAPHFLSLALALSITLSNWCMLFVFAWGYDIAVFCQLVAHRMVQYIPSPLVGCSSNPCLRIVFHGADLTFILSTYRTPQKSNNCWL